VPNENVQLNCFSTPPDSDERGSDFWQTLAVPETGWASRMAHTAAH